MAFSVSATTMQHAVLLSSGILRKVWNTAEIFLSEMNFLVKLAIHYIPEKNRVIFGSLGISFPRSIENNLYIH